MKITLFTSSEPRHIALAEALAEIADELYVCTEVLTYFTGEVEDFFRKSAVMKEYFSHVKQAQEQVFGLPRPFPKKAQVMAMKLNDLNRVPLEWMKNMLDSDLYIVFGASYIKKPLILFLEEKRAVNIHMGISPLYRGSSCNFWAANDGNTDLIGSTIHELTAGLDSGPILLHAVPAPIKADPFLVGMLAVQAAIDALTSHIKDGDLLKLPTILQDKSQEIRYTRNEKFTDEVAQEYLQNLPLPDAVFSQMQKRDVSTLHNPFIAEPYSKK
jgi:methionyl-tRNA formyltransferase